MPGFDDSELEAQPIFELFALWLLDVDARFQKRSWLHGIIYVQPISSGYTKAYKRCFDLLELACGTRVIQNMAIVFAMGEGDNENAAKVEAYKDTVFDKYRNRVTLKVDKRRQYAAIECIEVLWNCSPVRLQFLNEYERCNSFAMTSAGAFVDEDLCRKEIEIKKMPRHSQRTLELLEKIRLQRGKLHVNKEQMKTFLNWALRTAGARMFTVAGLCASPLVVHVGLPILTRSAALAVPGLVTGLAAS